MTSHRRASLPEVQPTRQPTARLRQPQACGCGIRLEREMSTMKGISESELFCEVKDGQIVAALARAWTFGFMRDLQQIGPFVARAARAAAGAAGAAGAIFLILGVVAAEPSESAREAILFDFTGRYCLECHDENVQKGERSFEEFELPLEPLDALITADGIIDQVPLKEMPPKKSKEQPSDEERLALTRALRESIAVTRGKFESTGGRPVMRRLSNREYENTLATLFGRRVDTLGLTLDFPKENTSRHMDNIVGAMPLSSQTVEIGTPSGKWRRRIRTFNR